MHRRRFIGSLSSAIALPSVVAAQQKSMPVIGLLMGSSPAPLTPFRQGLSETGYVEGQNVVIEQRWAEGHSNRLPAFAADLIARKVDLIVTGGGPAPALAAKRATSTMPIVFADVSDPVEQGFVASLPRPGGNLTGFNSMYTELIPKQLELLSELVPKAGMIALLVNPTASTAERIKLIIGDMQEAARTKRVKLPILKAATEGEIDAAFASLVQLHAGGLVFVPDNFFFARREQLVALAARHAVPAIYAAREFTETGGLISYGTSIPATYRQVGIYAGRILNGAKPADLPVQQPTKFELIINLKTAKALGLKVPQTLLARADEVIE
jgi:putative ABC transport system substrate-binding protein